MYKSSSNTNATHFHYRPSAECSTMKSSLTLPIFKHNIYFYPWVLSSLWNVSKREGSGSLEGSDVANMYPHKTSPKVWPDPAGTGVENSLQFTGSSDPSGQFKQADLAGFQSGRYQYTADLRCSHCQTEIVNGMVPTTQRFDSQKHTISARQDHSLKTSHLQSSLTNLLSNL